MIAMTEGQVGRIGTCSRRDRQAENDALAALTGRLDHVAHRSFASRRTEETLFGPGAEIAAVAPWTDFPEVPEDLPLGRGSRVALTAQQEARLFLQYNYARYRLGRLLAGRAGSGGRKRCEALGLWHRRMMQCKESLARANMALVVAMAKRTRIPNVEFSELISEGNMALLRSIEKFDVSRGFKFSTYGCRSILKSFNRLASKTGRYRKHFPVEYDPDLEPGDHGQTLREERDHDSLEDLRAALAANRARLSRIEQRIVSERFALGRSDRPRTLAEVGRMVGLTNERVRQIQKAALGKLRTALGGDEAAA
jgi:RNA polymerase primary sigma factor